MFYVFLSSATTPSALDRITDFIFNGVIKLIARLPASPFDTDQLLGSLSGVLEPLNYFIPFYLFSSIFAAWQAVFVTVFGITLTIKTITKR